MAIVKAAIGEITEQQSQADILKTLINRAASFAPRVAFFVIKGEQASGWRARGFEGSVGDHAIQEITISLNAETVIGNVTKSLTTWSGVPTSNADDYMLISKLGEEPPQRVVAIPLTVRKRAVAVLYADSAGLDSESINLEALETLVAVSGMAVELLSVARAPRREEQPTPPAAEPTPAYTPEREYEEQPQPESEAMADTLRPSYVQPEPEPEPAVEAPAFEQEIVEPGAEESSMMEPELAPEVHEPEPSPTRRRYGQDQDLPVDVASDEERRLHNDARRFARLLISEIKLYNEQKVAEGRSQGDLYDRLREYIDRSREMYDKRVRAEVAARYDYFHGELVNTLAEGDESKLGSSYPGATVTA
jgi:hypothetical protein